MNKIFDIMIGFGISIFALTIWAYKMLITSDIPVLISFNDIKLIVCLLILFIIVCDLYVRKTRFALVNMMLLLIPLFLWFLSLQAALIYHYHKYETLADVTGFIATLIPFVQLIYFKIKQ